MYEGDMRLFCFWNHADTYQRGWVEGSLKAVRVVWYGEGGSDRSSCVAGKTTKWLDWYWDPPKTTEKYCSVSIFLQRLSRSNVVSTFSSNKLSKSIVVSACSSNVPWGQEGSDRSSCVADKTWSHSKIWTYFVFIWICFKTYIFLWCSCEKGSGRNQIMLSLKSL